MKLLHVMQALWCEPWVVRPAMHERMCRIVEAHLSGAAHQPDGILARFLDEDEEEVKKPTLAVEGNVAVIQLRGVIGKHIGAFEQMSGVTDIDQFMADLETAAGDGNVKALLLEINSPGGQLTGVPEAAALVRKIGKIGKPVVAYTEELMASAAYWIGSAADAVYASLSASVGSVGVYMAWLDSSRAMEAEGYRLELIKSGKFKAMGIEGTSLTEEQRAFLQADVDKARQWFRSEIRLKRPGVSDETTEGQDYFAADALALDLVDAVAGRAEAMEEARDLASTSRNRK